jgi:acetyl-CoA C-acetyltransferase
MMKNAYIYDAIRSPRTRAKDSGGLHDLTPQELLRQLYESLRQRTGLDPATVGEVILGCVTQHGEQAGNIAKTSALYAGWPSHIGGMTVSRFCSSGIDAIALAALKIGAGQEQAIIAGGVEMMSRVPMLADKARAFIDPAFAAQCQMLMMGSGADLIASLYDVSREEADAIALASQQRAARARDAGWFKSIIPVENPAKGITCSQDECIRPSVTAEDLAALEPSFAKLGAMGVDTYQLAGYPGLAEVRHIHTAGNSPAMADAASLVLVGNGDAGRRLSGKPRARIALGHPLGATGAIMLGTLLDEMERRDLHRGVVAASGAAGSGIAMMIER